MYYIKFGLWALKNKNRCVVGALCHVSDVYKLFSSGFIKKCLILDGNINPYFINNSKYLSKNENKCVYQNFILWPFGGARPPG